MRKCNIERNTNETKIKVELNIDGPVAGGSFTLEIKPSVGASTLVSKTLSLGYPGGPII